MIRNTTILNLSVFALVGGVLACHAAYYYPFLSDDALISLRYSQRLIHGLGLTWTDGEKVEGYTNLLWVLINAACGALGFDLIISARSIGFIGALGAIYAVSIAPHTGYRLDRVRLITAGMTLALSAPLAVWSIGALEHGFMAGILAIALFFFIRALQPPQALGRDILIASLLFAMLALLRADGIILFTMAGMGLLVSHGINKKTFKCLISVAALPFFLLLLQFIFRIIYYKEILPNTAYAKVSINLIRLESGLLHVAKGFLAIGVFCILVLLAAVISAKSGALRKTDRHRLVIPLMVSAGWTAYIIVVGGDIFPGWRQLLISIIPLSLVFADGIGFASAWIRRHGVIFSVCWVAVLSAHLILQMFDAENRRAKDELWEWGGYSVGHVLKSAFSKYQPLLAVDAAGALPYWSQLPSLDMLGLNDKFIAKNPPADFGVGNIGHELGNGDYVWRTSPDIIAFNNANGAPLPSFRSGKQLLAKPEFAYTYQFIKVQGIIGNRSIGNLYIKYNNGPLGIQRTSNALRIPGYLFSGIVSTGAQLDKDNRLFTPITANQPGRIDKVFLDKGNWQLSTQPQTSSKEVVFFCKQRSTKIPTSSSTRSLPMRPILKVDRPMYVDIWLKLHRTPAANTTVFRLREVFLKRVENQSATHFCRQPFTSRHVRLQDLSNRKPEGTLWNHPDNLLLTDDGVSVSMRQLSYPTHIEMSADNNDSYVIQYKLRGKVVADTQLGPKPNSGGLAEYSIQLPSAVSQNGIDSLVVKPLKGDRSYSIGHLILR